MEKADFPCQPEAEAAYRASASGLSDVCCRHDAAVDVDINAVRAAVGRQDSTLIEDPHEHPCSRAATSAEASEWPSNLRVSELPVTRLLEPTSRSSERGKDRRTPHRTRGARDRDNGDGLAA